MVEILFDKFSMAQSACSSLYMTRGEGVLDLVESKFAIIIGFKPTVNPSWLFQVNVPSMTFKALFFCIDISLLATRT